MEEHNGESKIRKIILSDLGILVSIVIGVFSFIFFIIAPQYEIRGDIALIQQSIDNINKNHEQHIQDILATIEKIQIKMEDNEKEHLEIQKALIKLLK